MVHIIALAINSTTMSVSTGLCFHDFVAEDDTKPMGACKRSSPMGARSSPLLRSPMGQLFARSPLALARGIDLGVQRLTNHPVAKAKVERDLCAQPPRVWRARENLISRAVVA